MINLKDRLGMRNVLFEGRLWVVGRGRSRGVANEPRMDEKTWSWSQVIRATVVRPTIDGVQFLDKFCSV